jgi:seryl-tRNA synthetase
VRRARPAPRKSPAASRRGPRNKEAAALDLKLIRSDPEGVKAALARRGAADSVDELLALDEQRRKLLPQIEQLRSRRKKGGGDPEEARALRDEIRRLEQELAAVDAGIERLLASLPNLPDPTAPDGDSEEDAEVLREVGTPPQFDFEPRDHLDLGTALGVIDVESAARASGSRFAYLKGDLVRVEFALVQFALATLEPEGFIPVVPPVLVREEPLFWTGFLPTDRAQIYEIANDDLFLVGTSEVSLAALHAEDLLAEADLPLRYAGFSTCFRREAGAAGRDTRGIFRVHQFDKVEMFSFVRPEDSPAEHERILSIEERIMQAIGIPYRVVNIPAGDLGASAAKKYDLEAWLPGQGRFRELTSCSNTTDYQARRLRARYRPEGAKSPQPVHTLNGTAVAVGRTIVAIMENFQSADGGVDVPPVLREHGAPDQIRPVR